MGMKTILDELRAFVQAEHEANLAKLYDVWSKPLAEKLNSGLTQRISQVKIDDKNHLLVTLGKGDSRFREGDMICLHHGEAKETTFIQQATIEAENEGEWLVRTVNQDLTSIDLAITECYADPDGMDMKPFYDKALNDIANSSIGQNIILPLLAGELEASVIYPDNYDDAADFAEAQGLNESQIDAVAKGVAAKYLACIQGPPGTGKTKVISLIAKCLVNEGQAVLLTSHTHMAINNALNKIASEGVPTAKIGAAACLKGLEKEVGRYENAYEWKNRPDSGYVIGATPFATCTSRLENYTFDTVIFDEASQITVPLAVMAMRNAKRFVFVGDHKQLPPVVLSKSVLNNDGYSVFAKLVLGNQETSVMLNETYRMNRHLSLWPSQQYYQGKLQSSGDNANRQFRLPGKPQKYSRILSEENSLVFIKSPGVNAKTSCQAEATLVADIIQNAVNAALNSNEIGVVSPYRSQGKAIRKELTKSIGLYSSKVIVTDTVERMQGQEREMIILSFCTTDPLFLTSVAAFFFQSERLNVAITRPKTKLIIIGPHISDDFVQGIRDGELREKINAYQSLVTRAVECNIDEG